MSKARRRQRRRTQRSFGTRRYPPARPEEARQAVLLALGATAPGRRESARLLADATAAAVTSPEGPRRYVGELVWDALRAGEARDLGALERHTCERIAACRTPALGGARERCAPCAFEQTVFRSCGSRHCPRCQSLVGARWHAQEVARVLEVDHFHLVITLPPALRERDPGWPRALYGLLFRAVRRAIEATAREVLGEPALLAITLVLHTWNSSFEWHPHVHAIVSAGGLSQDGSRWLQPRPGQCLLPADVLRRHAREAFARELGRAARAARRGQLDGLGIPLEDPELERRLERLADEYVHVYAKQPLAGPLEVIGYLARYVGRPGFSDRQLLDYDAASGRVVYRTKRGERVETTRRDFLRRLASHQLPKGFHRIRRYGLLSPRRQTERLAAARTALGVSRPSPPATKPAEGGSFVEEWWREQGVDLCACPQCGARLQATEIPPNHCPRARRAGWPRGGARRPRQQPPAEAPPP
ncbi:MAG: transposase [Planctomycetota bacterium]